MSIIKTKMNEPYTYPEVVEALKIFDINQEGTIDAQELKNVCMKLGDWMKASDIDEIIADADPQGDGKINIEEFADLLLEKSKLL